MSAARTVRVPRPRVAGWVERFADRHGPLTSTPDPESLRLDAADGAMARLHVPFRPWPWTAQDPVAALVEHLRRDRTVAVLLARRGGHAVGVFTGDELVAAKVGSHYVQGQTKAGGWSQQRYARRRANQADRAAGSAAEDAAALLLPRLDTLQHLLLGGDRRVVEDVLAHPSLDRIARLPREPDVRSTPDPRLVVLQQLDPTSIRVDLNPLA